MTEAAGLTVCEAAAALESGALSSLELTEDCIRRAESRDGQLLNAFIHIAGDQARTAARESDERRKSKCMWSPLDGIPIAVKDNIDVLGMSTTNGLATSWLPKRDAPLIAQLRGDGLVMLGKLNMHEGALGATTDNVHHGRCMHPDFPGFTPGGSSGGSAAAVAGDLCPVALGSDTMGSVRLPAAYCGIVGLKPSRGMWSIDGVMPLGRGLDTIGPMARTTGDLALLLNVMLDVPSLDELRLGVLDYGASVEIKPECQAILDNALVELRKHGARFETVEMTDYSPGQTRRAGFLVSEVDGAEAHAELLAQEPAAFSQEFLAMLKYGQNVTEERYEASREAIETAGQLFREKLAAFDAILSLTAPQRAFRFDEVVPTNQADLTAIANFSGCPAISLPIPVPTGERPVGLQVLSSPGSDHALIRIAQLFETVFSAAR